MELIQLTKPIKNNLFTAARLRANGVKIADKKPLSVAFPSNYADAAQTGSIWEVEGDLTPREFKSGSFTVKAEHLAIRKAKFVKPNTALLETWLRRNIDGVGEQKAKRIAAIPFLERVIEAGDPTNFLDIPPASFDQLQSKFPRDEYAAALDWLARHNLPVKLANSISSVWRGKTLEILADNPFRLMQFNLSFEKCKKVAAKFGIDENNDKYKAAQAIDIISRYIDKTSSTFMPRIAFEQECTKLKIDHAEILETAMRMEFVGYLRTVDGYQLEGHFLLEALLATKLRNSFFRANGDLCETGHWETSLTDDEIAHYIEEFDQTQSFRLTHEQRHAVKLACKFKVVSISGGAGTGKTSVLKAVLSVIHKASLGIPIVQVALSGRASQRMSEATGRPASTIAKFCVDMKNTPEDKRPDHLVCVVDEASMVDLYSMSNLIEYLPAATRFIFVGDVDQLPPVGGGLVFHNLMLSDFPKVSLTAVKRQGEQSGIHRFATDVRNENEQFRLDRFSSNNNSDCSVFNSVDPDKITELFTSLGGSKRGVILTATRGGAAGVNNLNSVMQKAAGLDRQCVFIDAGDGVYDYMSATGVKFYLNDPILITKNDYNIGIRNGDLAFIEEIFDEQDLDADNQVFGILNIDGRKIDLTFEVLDKMDLGYAITIHKSQGSQWQNVILVLDGSAKRMLDKTLLYTGVTRAEKKLVICCEKELLIDDAIASGAVAHKRSTNLLQHLNKDF